MGGAVLSRPTGSPRDCTDEPVPESVHRPDKPRILSNVIERSTDPCNRAGKVGVEDEGRRPEVLLQLGSGHRSGSVLDERQQQIEGLGGEGLGGKVDFPLTLQESASIGIQGEVMEPVRHWPEF
jgi:hypothetical protein